MSDICVRLVRFEDKYNPHICTSSDLEVEAAAAIDALREENARLREALKDLIEDHEYMTDTDFEDDNLARAAARAAIREGGQDE